MKQGKGPEFIRFFRPIIQVMRNLGESGTASEIIARSLEVAQVTEAEQQAGWLFILLFPMREVRA